MKPDKFGIKLYQVCEASTGYTVGFDVYHSNTVAKAYVEALENEDSVGLHSELTATSEVVLGLLAICGLLSKRHHIYTDIYYMLPELFE